MRIVPILVPLELLEAVSSCFANAKKNVSRHPYSTSIKEILMSDICKPVSGHSNDFIKSFYACDPLG